MEETKQEIIKLLAINKPGGSGLHRVSYFEKLNGVEIEGKKIEVTIKDFSETTLKEAEDYSIFLYHWDINLTFTQLGQLQAKGIRIIYSIDDFWEFSVIHPYYENEQLRNYTLQRIRTHLLNADVVLTTTQRLAWNCLKYNDNVAILPNFLNPADFKIGEKTKSDKLRVGFTNSLSHYPDMLMFKQVVNKLAKNKKIAENVEFCLYGVDSNDAKWLEIINMFKKKKNLTVTVKEFLPVDKYMKFYEDLDICLLPLELTEFNYCKSALKLAECALSNTLPVGSSLYSAKELKGIVVAEQPVDYEKTIEKLLDRDYYNQVLKYVTETNLKDNNWEKRFEDTKLVINTVYSEDLSSKLDNVKLWSIVYDNENQVAEYEKYDNSSVRTVEQKSYLFEYNPLLDIINNKLEEKDAYLGVFSWKLNQKTGFTKNILLKSLKHYNYKEFDVINLTPSYKDLSPDKIGFYKWTDQIHPTWMDKFTKLCNHLKLDISEPDSDKIIFSNMVIAKTSVYREFVKSIITPAIKYLETEMKEEAFENSKYNSELSPEKLEELTGLNFWTFHTFILERLWGAYLMTNKNLTIKKLL